MRPTASIGILGMQKWEWALKQYEQSMPSSRGVRDCVNLRVSPKISHDPTSKNLTLK